MAARVRGARVRPAQARSAALRGPWRAGSIGAQSRRQWQMRHMELPLILLAGFLAAQPGGCGLTRLGLRVEWQATQLAFWPWSWHPAHITMFWRAAMPCCDGLPVSQLEG